MPIKLNGATNGSVELNVPDAVGSDLQMTLPATAGEIVVKAADGSVDLGSVDIDSSGDVLIGGTLPSSPNISLNAADGSATFAGRLKSTNWPASPGFSIQEGAIEVARNGDDSVFVGYSLDGGLTETSVIKADGSATFASSASSPSDSHTVVAFNSSPATATTSTYFAKNTAGGRLWKGSDGTETSTIWSDGSATFAGSVDVGAGVTNSALAGGRLSNQGIVQARRSGSAAVWLGYTLNSNNATSQINANGSAMFAGTINGATVGTSDARFKENITPANPQLADVVALGGILKNYDWTDEAPVNEELRSVRQLGLVAQEVETICPSLVKDINRTKTMEITPAVFDAEGEVTVEAVTKEVDDSYKGLSQEALIMKLIGAVAELSAKVAALEATS